MVVGAIFLILIVIHPWSSPKATRISKVAARFALDAMPGAMAIDADLSASSTSGSAGSSQGDRPLGRLLRAMTASKVVRGDAIAGI